MGWWHVEPNKALIGDQPLATLRDALQDITAQYEKALKRRPSKVEWEALIAAAMAVQEGDPKLMDRGAVKKVALEVG